MSMEFTVLIERGEDGYLVSDVLELPGCHTQGKTVDELLERTKEAILLYLESGKDLPVKTKFLGLQKLDVEA